MRFILVLLMCLYFVPVAALGQERITRVMAGPSDDKFLVLVSFIAMTEDISCSL